MSPERALSPKPTAVPAVPRERDAEHVVALRRYWKRQFPLSNLTRSKHFADASTAQFVRGMPAGHRLSLLARVMLVSDGDAAS